MVPARLFFRGRPGWVRSKAWIWDFSSTLRTTAWAGGSTYRPTMSRTLAANFGSLESLKVRRRRAEAIYKEFARDIRQEEWCNTVAKSAQLLTARKFPVQGTEHRAAAQKRMTVSTAPAKMAISTPS